MTLTSNLGRENLPYAVVATLGIAGLWFWLTWRYGFDLGDEGYYWYGAQRVLRGEVPMRDFAAYDIGRYYWAASFMHLMGDDGVFGARVSAAVYQAIGTFLGIYICLLSLRQDGVVKWIFALLIACILTVWAFPYYKAYDHATSIMVVAALVLMLKVAEPWAWLCAGLCLGVAAMMGRNHGLYGAMAATFIVSLLLIKAPSRRTVIGLCGYFILGILLGFSPTLIMMFAVEGFAGAMIDSVVTLVRWGATNLALPVPWPWSANLEGLGIALSAVQLSVGMGFVFLLAFPLFGILALAYRRFDFSTNGRKVFVAATAASIPYAHYAFSRADATHLSLGIFPLLIGLLAAAGATSRYRPLVLALGLFAVSVVTVNVSQPFLYTWYLKQTLWQTDVDGRQLWMNPYVSTRLQLATKALSNQAGGSGRFLAVPDMTSLYAIYRTKMPLWEIYSVIPRDAEFEGREIARLESFAPDLVLLSDHALDRRSELRYSRTHPLIYEWIVSKYQLSDFGERYGNPDFRVYGLKH